MIGTQYFRALRTPLTAGREFNEHDLEPWSKAAIVNEQFVRELVGGQNAVGRRFWIEATPYEPQIAFEIVAVARHTKYRICARSSNQYYSHRYRRPRSRAHCRIVIRSSARLDRLATQVRSTLAGTSPDIRYSFHVFDTRVQESLLRERLMATLSGVFGVLAMVLTAAGLYGVISYMVARRTSEIGIRVARRGPIGGAVIALILREAAVVLAAGTLLALAAGRAAAALLFGWNGTIRSR